MLGSTHPAQSCFRGRIWKLDKIKQLILQHYFCSSELSMKPCRSWQSSFTTPKMNLVMSMMMMMMMEQSLQGFIFVTFNLRHYLCKLVMFLAACLYIQQHCSFLFLCPV